MTEQTKAQTNKDVKKKQKKELVLRPLMQNIDFTEWLKVNKIKKHKKPNPKHKKTVNYSKGK